MQHLHHSLVCRQRATRQDTSNTNVSSVAERYRKRTTWAHSSRSEKTHFLASSAARSRRSAGVSRAAFPSHENGNMLWDLHHKGRTLIRHEARDQRCIMMKKQAYVPDACKACTPLTRSSGNGLFSVGVQRLSTQSGWRHHVGSSRTAQTR